MSHKGWGFLFTCPTCLSLSNILWIQKRYIKFSPTLLANLLREMKPWSKVMLWPVRFWLAWSSTETKAPLRPFAPGYFPLVSRLVQCRPPDHLSTWSLFQQKTLGILFLCSFFPLCSKRPKDQTTWLLRETKVFKSIKMLQDLMHACCFLLAHFAAYKHILLLSKKKNVYQKWHLSSSLTVSQDPAWQRRGKGR